MNSANACNTKKQFFRGLLVKLSYPAFKYYSSEPSSSSTLSPMLILLTPLNWKTIDFHVFGDPFILSALSPNLTSVSLFPIAWNVKARACSTDNHVEYELLTSPCPTPALLAQRTSLPWCRVRPSTQLLLSQISADHLASSLFLILHLHVELTSPMQKRIFATECLRCVSMSSPSSHLCYCRVCRTPLLS